MAAQPLDVMAYKDALIVLATAAVVVPLIQRLRISSVLGFLLAGALLGPKGLGALAGIVPGVSWISVSQSEAITLIAELGIVFLLFLIGLELSLARLITMRRLVFGLGTLQVVVSTIVLGAIAALWGLAAGPAIVIGAALALSSTAIVLRVLSDEQRLTTSTGRVSFSVLLLQDLAVVPLLLLVGILAANTEGGIVAGLAKAFAQAIMAIGLVVVAGRLVFRPLFRMVAANDSPELFTAATLLVAVGTAVAFASAGLSMALGAFVAGLLLAETEYHKAVEATIAPFQGLLLGVFFFTVGMTLDIARLLSDPLPVLLVAGGLMAVKVVIQVGLARLFALPAGVAIESALLLASGGEFAFIAIGLAITMKLVEPGTGTFLLAVVSLTMAMIPLMAFAGRRLAAPYEAAAEADADLLATPSGDVAPDAILVGHGRVGEMVADLLEWHGISYLATDHDPHTVGRWRRRQRPIYFGDAKNPAFLKSCGIGDATALVITIHAQKEIDEIVRVARVIRPDILVVARARDARHASHLYELGVNDAVPETIEASLLLSEAALAGLGVPKARVSASVQDKREEIREILRGAAPAPAKVQR